jgi:hypothetical protein
LKTNIPDKGECQDEFLGSKMIHWAGMLMVSELDADYAGASVVLSDGISPAML